MNWYSSASRDGLSILKITKEKKIKHVHVHVTMENSNGNLGNGLLVDPSHIILKHKKPSKTSKRWHLLIKTWMLVSSLLIFKYLWSFIMTIHIINLPFDFVPLIIFFPKFNHANKICIIKLIISQLLWIGKFLKVTKESSH